MTVRLDKPTRMQLAASLLAVGDLYQRQARMLRDRGEAALQRSTLPARTREALTRYGDEAQQAKRVLGRPASLSEALRRAIEGGSPLQPSWLPAGCVLLPIEVANVMCAGTDGFLRGLQPTRDFQRQLFTDLREQAVACLDAAKVHPTTALVPLELLRHVGALLGDVAKGAEWQCQRDEQQHMAAHFRRQIETILKAARPCS